MYGAQTQKKQVNKKKMFENDVEMYGAQTFVDQLGDGITFENDVEMYGAQTMCLRVEYLQSV